MPPRPLTLALLLLLPAAPLLPAPAGPAAVVPALLRARCGSCHGASVRKAGLDLSSPAALHRGAGSGPVVVAGKPDESPLYRVLRDGKMPPAGPRLSAAEVAAVRAWIEGGAGAPAPTGPEVTQHDVLPLLHLRCATCHGRRVQEGGLDIRTRAALLRGGKSGPALVPGRPEASLLVQRVHAGEMPPPRRVVEASVKPMEPEELRRLERWIVLGAPEVSAPPPDGADAGITAADRRFWAFQPPRAVPAPAAFGREANPVDAFLRDRLRRAGLDLAPEADRSVLVRRATYALTGLPPTPEETAAFLADRAPGAWERVIDRLLTNPRCGEKWGRHWLDLAGYSDSEGIQDSDLIRPGTWRYRDYVIRSFNADKPYDRFLLEQLAGDELADYERAPEITRELEDNLVATGFLRMAPDGTHSNITGFVPDRLDVVSDELTVLGSAVLGLTVRCARCHDHKFDPLPQRDYYRLAAVFKGAFDEHDWLSPYPGERPAGDLSRFRLLPYVTTAERRGWEAREAVLAGEIRTAREELAVAAAAARRRLGLKDGSPEEELRRLDAAYGETAAAAERRLKELEGRREPVPLIRALWDRGEPSPTYVLKRGSYLTPGAPVEPGVPSVLEDPRAPFVVRPPWPGARSTGRRLALARWLTRPEHPLTARVLVNRAWHQLFGAGLVRTPDNFGRAGARPTHPELLDFLAHGFARGSFGKPWSVKALLRLLTTSRAYRQASVVPDAVRRPDPENRLLSRMPVRRLEAEEVYDSLLYVSGRLDETRFGKPDTLEARADGLVRAAGTERGWRRSVYVTDRRKQPLSLLEAFDRPAMSPNCTVRTASTVAPQALHLLNDGRVRLLAAAFAARVREQAGAGRGAQVELAHRLAAGRPPDAAERRLGLEALARLEAAWKRSGPPAAAEERALAAYCHALLNSAAFLHVD